MSAKALDATHTREGRPQNFVGSGGGVLRASPRVFSAPLAQLFELAMLASLGWGLRREGATPLKTARPRFNSFATCMTPRLPSAGTGPWQTARRGNALGRCASRHDDPDKRKRRPGASSQSVVSPPSHASRHDTIKGGPRFGVANYEFLRTTDYEFLRTTSS